MTAEDRKLIEALIDGRKSAFEKLYRMYSVRVFNLANFLLKDTGWSEDIVQEVFVKLWENRRGLQPDQSLWAYLYVLTRRLSLNKLRSVKRSKACFERLSAHFSESEESLDHIVIAKERKENIRRLLSLLPFQQRTVFLLSRIEGFTHKEIAKQLNISPNTVKNHIVQATKRLKDRHWLYDLFIFIAFFYFN